MWANNDAATMGVATAATLTSRGLRRHFQASRNSFEMATGSYRFMGSSYYMLVPSDNNRSKTESGP